MPSPIDGFFQPERPDLREKSPAYPMIGIVRDTYDPEGLGRIQVIIPEIDEATPLPNGSDGWVPMVVPFTLNETMGGVFFPVETGTEILILPLNGKMNRAIALGCVYNRHDRPDPEFSNPNRYKHGFKTRGGTIEVYDDSEGSRVTAFPTGAVQRNDKHGNIDLQTFDNATLHLGRDGNATIGNEESSTSYGADGSLTIDNSTAASVALTVDGEIKIESRDKSKIKTSKTDVAISAPGPERGNRLAESVGFLSAELAIAARQIKTLKQFTEHFLGQYKRLEGDDELSEAAASREIRSTKAIYLVDILKVLAPLNEGFIDNFQDNLAALEKLSVTAINDWVDLLSPFVTYAVQINLDKIVEILASESSAEELNPQSVYDTILGSTEIPNYLSEVSEERKVKILKTLEELKLPYSAIPNEEDRLLLLLSVFIDWEWLESLVGMKIYDKTFELERTINPDSLDISTITKKDELAWWDKLQSNVQATIAKLPQEMQKIASWEELKEAFQLNQGSEEITESELTITYSGTLLKSLWGCHSKSEPGETEEREGEQTLEEIQRLLVPGESPLVLLISLLFGKLIQEAVEKLKEISELKDSVKLPPLIEQLARVLQSKEITFETQRLPLLEGVRAVAEYSTVTAEFIEDGELSQAEKADIALLEFLPDVIDKLKSELGDRLQQYENNFSFLVNAIPTHPEGTQLVAHRNNLTLTGKTKSGGAKFEISDKEVNLHGPNIGWDESQRSQMSIGVSDVVLKVGDKGPILRADRRVSEILGAERDAPEDVRDEDESDNSPEAQSSDKSATWKRPDGEVTYRFNKFGGFKPFDQSLTLTKGGIKKKKDKSKVKFPTGKPPANKDFSGIAGDTEKQKCKVRSSITTERSGAVTMKAQPKGGVIGVHNKKAELWGPEVEDETGNLFRTSFSALEEEVAGEAGPDGGTFFVGRDRSQFLAPERGDAKYREDNDDLPDSNKDGYQYKLSGFKTLEDGSESEKDEPMVVGGEQRFLRAGMDLSKTGVAHIYSGGEGAGMFINDQKTEIYSPTVDGERFKHFATKHSIGYKTTEKGAKSFSDIEKSVTLGPENAEGVRSLLKNAIDQVLAEAGGDGAKFELTNVIANVKSPGDLTELILDRAIAKVSGLGNAEMLLDGNIAKLVNQLGTKLSIDGVATKLLDELDQEVLKMLPSEALELFSGGTLVKFAGGTMFLNGLSLEQIIVQVVKKVFGL